MLRYLELAAASIIHMYYTQYNYNKHGKRKPTKLMTELEIKIIINLL